MGPGHGRIIQLIRLPSERHHPEGTTGPGLSSFADTQEDTIADTHRLCNLGPLSDDIPANEGLLRVIQRKAALASNP